MSDKNYSTIRELIGDFKGKRVTEITQQDSAEWDYDHESYVALHFEDGRTLKFPIGDAGFDVQVPD